MAADGPGCCVYPHGGKSVLVMLLGILATLLTLSSTMGCYYMRIDGYLYETAPFVARGSKYSTSSVGLFSYKEFNEFSSSGSEYECMPYSDEQLDDFLDGWSKAARLFGMLANISIGLGMFFLLVLSCVEYPKVALYGIGGLIIVGSVFQALTFLVYGSSLKDEPFNGRFWVGSYLSIAATVVALQVGIMTTRLPASRKGFSKNDVMLASKEKARSDQSLSPFRPGTETVTETIMPDGSRKTTTTTVNADLSKTTKETIVQGP